MSNQDFVHGSVHPFVHPLSIPMKRDNLKASRQAASAGQFRCLLRVHRKPGIAPGAARTVLVLPYEGPINKRARDFDYSQGAMACYQPAEIEEARSFLRELA